jgi:hypothetical protein
MHYFRYKKATYLVAHDPSRSDLFVARYGGRKGNVNAATRYPVTA